MSDPQAILAQARRAGLRLWREGDRIGFAPARLCPPDLLERIRAVKAQLLDLLEAEAARLTPDCAPWLHIARQVLAGEFDGGDRSLLESLHIGLRSIRHPLCESAKARLEAALGHRRGVRQ